MAAQPKPGLLEAITTKCIPGWFIPGGCKVNEEEGKKEESFASSIGKCLEMSEDITESEMNGILECLHRENGDGKLLPAQERRVRIKVLVACFLLSDTAASTACELGRLKDH
eukprot:gb/GECG01010371.1/.p1 GENE.gb/GECG01010371.1/~~gb/GECG01010371.1/.p1  ORF type:complete len:112 (+),score=14.19 gb/GECG01010371.1/:1-336(+)